MADNVPTESSSNQANDGIDFLKAYLKEHSDDIYKITIEEKEYSIKVKAIIDYITMKDEFRYMLLTYGANEIENIPSSHFMYAVLSFFIEKFGDLKIRFGDPVEGRLRDIYNDKEIKMMNKNYKSNDPNLSRIIVNKELKDAILKGVPSWFYENKLALAIAIYIKMCKLLTYDDEFFAVDQKGESAKIHEDITHISEITPENNKVVCYEFAAIYEAMLQEFGILSEIIKSSEDYDTYGKEHTAVRFKVYGYLITADAVTSILGGDLFAVKIDSSLLHGIKCQPKLMKELYENIKFIFNELCSKDNNLLSPQELDENLSEYAKSTDNIKEVDINERINILITKANSAKLKGVDCLGYLLYLRRRLFPGKLSKFIDISIIRDNTHEKTTARAILVIKAIDEDGKEEFNYYSYLPNEPLQKLSLEELQLMFDNGDLAYIKENGKNTINGIKVK